MKIKTWDYYWEIYISIFVLNENIKNYSKKIWNNKKNIGEKSLPRERVKGGNGKMMRRAEFKNQSRWEKNNIFTINTYMQDEIRPCWYLPMIQASEKK